MSKCYRLILGILTHYYKHFHEIICQDAQQLSLWYFVSFIGGCVYGLKIEKIASWPQVLTGTIILGLALIMLRKKFLALFITALALFFLLGILNCQCHGLQDLRNQEIITKPNVFSKIEGTICKVEQFEKMRQIVIHKVRIGEHGRQDISGNLRLNIAKKYWTPLQKGQIIIVKALLNPIAAQILPGGYDFNTHAKVHNIKAIGFVLSKPQIIGFNENFWDKAQSVIYQRITSQIASAPANFIAALIIGQTKGIESSTVKNMRAAGLSHILCISGLHLSLIAIICFKFWRFTLNASNWLAHKVNIKIIAGIIAMLFSYGYLKLSGSQVSATRAFIMCSIASFAFIIQRDYNPLRAVGVSGAGLLLINPNYCLLPGFQLSFLSVLALIAGYKKSGLKSSSLPPFLAKIKNHLMANFYSSLLIGFSTAPIVIYHFFTVANYSPLANIIAVPITTFVLMPCAFALFLAIPLGCEYYLLKFMAYFTNLISVTASVIAHLDYSTINIGTINGTNVCIYLLGFFWAIIWQSKIRYLAILPMLFACIRTYNDFKPDLVLDVEKIILGFINKQQQLTIYSVKKLTQFTTKYWASWFGKSSQEHYLIAKNQNIDFIIAHDKKIALVFDHENCNINADFIINYSNVPCHHANTFNVSCASKKFLLLKCNTTKCWSYDK